MTAGQRSAADSHELIEVRGARENNLADISLDGQVVFTGTPADLVAHGDSLTAQHLADAP